MLSLSIIAFHISLFFTLLRFSITPPPFCRLAMRQAPRRAMRCRRRAAIAIVLIIVTPFRHYFAAFDIFIIFRDADEPRG
jgi:hypothetical protein